MSLAGILRYLTTAVGNTLPLFGLYLLTRWGVLRLREGPGWRQRLLPKREAALAALAGYLICLYQITVVRFGVDWAGLPSLERSMETVQLLPLVHTLEELRRGLWAFVYPVAGNLLWFWPLGLLAPLAFPRWRGWGRIALLCAGVSLSIEVAQWLLGTGVSDVDDLLFNLLGGLSGYGCRRLWERRNR